MIGMILVKASALALAIVVNNCEAAALTKEGNTKAKRAFQLRHEMGCVIVARIVTEQLFRALFAKLCHLVNSPKEGGISGVGDATIRGALLAPPAWCVSFSSNQRAARAA